MSGRVAILARSVATICLIGQAHGFVWPIDNVYGAGQFKYTFSELYMYAAEDAPLGIRTGTGSITLDLQVNTVSSVPEDLAVKVAIFHVPLKVLSGIPSNIPPSFCT